ncbi:MAG: hypothetical protein U1F42_05110 [Candidatus Competibacteraceae bacterium]
MRWLIGWHTDLIRLKMIPELLYLSNLDLRSMPVGSAGPTGNHFAHPVRTSGCRQPALYSPGMTTQVNAQLLLETFLSDGADGL